MRSTKYVALLVATLGVLSALGSAARSADFEVSAVPSGANWVYTLTNNTTDRYVAEWYLYWLEPIGSDDDNALADANFDENTGHIAFPGGWEQAYTYTNHPGFSSIGEANNTNRIGPGGTKTGFEVHYGGALPLSFSFVGPQLPGYASIVHNNSSGGDLQEVNIAVPEPGSMLTLLAGCVGCLAALRRRR